MVVRVLQSGDSKSQGQVIHVPGIGPCLVCDDASVGTAVQLTTWLAAARTAGAAANLLVAPRLGAVRPSPDNHVYLALDANGKLAAQITAT